MFEAFLHDGLPARIVFAQGAVTRLPDECSRLGIRHVLIVTTPEQADKGEWLRSLLGPVASGLFPRARMHTPTDVSEDACRMAEELRCDGVIAIGGGSTTGLAKAIALRTDLPQIVIPTTYAGSEVTPVLGETDSGRKATQRTLRVLPEVVIYDVDLTTGLPVGMSVTSGMNAIAHAAEALYAPQVSPIVAMMAEDGVRALVRALPQIAASPADIDARSEALYGAWLCGTCLGVVGMALHHKLCHVLGGAFDLPHAETHTVILPHVLAYNLPASDAARERLARATGDSDPAGALLRLARRLGAPTDLRSLGMPEGGVAEAARIAVGSPYPNPRSFDEASIARILKRAWLGEPPTADQ
ncbi:maleylacetate reductase [Sphingomonas sp. BK580]|uniref:maleylacetate reductase n=1 Tax=Sphingomonas sp. BK580 TaxID=2586972 RepID=UPI00161A204D|nr:maleylacetate reductase [Sphingomonas sp. BK580]MBB3694644.1 alcohol dehydrogenase class IV [Sphingomonas sp. BK580]